MQSCVIRGLECVPASPSGPPWQCPPPCCCSSPPGSSCLWWVATCLASLSDGSLNAWYLTHRHFSIHAVSPTFLHRPFHTSSLAPQISFGFPYNGSASPGLVAIFSLFPWSLLSKGLLDLADATTGTLLVACGMGQGMDPGGWLEASACRHTQFNCGRTLPQGKTCRPELLPRSHPQAGTNRGISWGERTSYCWARTPPPDVQVDGPAKGCACLPACLTVHELS